MRRVSLKSLLSGVLVAAVIASGALQSAAQARPCEDCEPGGGGGTGGGGGGPAPTPPPACGNQRVIIRLVGIGSRDTEDLVWPGDELYLGGGGRATNGAVTGLLTQPVQIGWGQHRTFDPSQSVAFDGVVRSTDTVTVGLEVFDEDFSKDWGRRPAIVDEITAAIASGLISLGPYGIAGAAALGVGHFLMSYVDPDDLLANIGIVETACGPAHETGSRTFRQGGWYSSWDYTLDYEVIRLPA